LSSIRISPEKQSLLFNWLFDISDFNFFPYLFIDNGLSIAWHGAIEAPLQWISTNPEKNPSFSKALFFMMNASAAGVCGWMLFVAALPGMWILRTKQLKNRKQRLSILPIASVVYIIGLSYSLTRKNIWWHYQLMGVLPITLFGVIGLIHLDSTYKRSTTRLPASLALILSIIFAYNIFIPEVRGIVNHRFQNHSSENQKVVVQEYNKVLEFIKSLPEKIVNSLRLQTFDCTGRQALWPQLLEPIQDGRFTPMI